MALPTKQKRDKAVTVRLSEQSYEQLVKLAENHGLSQADVIEHLLQQETEEQKRLKGKQGRYKRR